MLPITPSPDPLARQRPEPAGFPAASPDAPENDAPENDVPGNHAALPGLLPGFIIAGVPKAGTSSLFTWIADHPDACGSTEKETYFFVDPGTHMHRPGRHAADGLAAYARYFPAPPGPAPRVVLESTPAYVYSATALARIPALPTRPKCLFVLREPAAQVYSAYQYFRNNWGYVPRGMSFGAYLDAVRAGSHDFNGNEQAQNALRYAAYVDYLEPWRDRLGAERMRVRLFDDLVADPRGFTREIAAWLGLDPAFYDGYGFPRDNDTYAVKSPTLQRLNLALRARLPKGAAYRGLRRLYRRLNTGRPTGPEADDRALIAELRASFRPANARLAAAFGLDLAPWDRADQDRAGG
jgi:hypothetical protein